jgi:hypothetical protein
MARKQKTKTIAGPLILNERTELVPIDSIQPWEGNPNQGDLGAIITLMQRHGFWGTLLVQKSSSRIVAGNFRWRAAQHLGYKQVPVTFIDVPDRQAREILAADNRSNRLGTDDPALMAEWLQSIVSDVGDLGGTGYAQEALDQLIADLTQPDLGRNKDPEAQIARADELAEKWGTSNGQIWNVGQHRLMIGDSSDSAHVAELMGGARADGICTDPPYDLESHQVIECLENFGNVAVVLGGGRQLYEMMRYWRYRLDFIWIHPTPRMTAGLNYPLINHVQAVVMTRSEHVKSGWRKPRPEYSSVLKTEKEYDLTGFGQGKTAQLFELMMEGFKWETVADPFCGTGATILACETTGRRCLAMEIDPKHAAVALQRCSDAGLQASRQPDRVSGNNDISGI